MSDSQWNLSVRLTGQGSDLARTLRSTARDARAASRDVNTLRRDIDRLRQSARNNIRVRVRLDAGSLRNDLRTALTSAGAGQGLSVDLRLGNAMQLRREVSDAVRWAAWGHRIEIPIGLRDPNQLRRDVSAAVRRAQQNQTIRIRVTADTSGLNGLTNNLNAGGGNSGGEAEHATCSWAFSCWPPPLCRSRRRWPRSRASWPPPEQQRPRSVSR
ncbi:hypothetical protein KJK32_46985 (plasmid) [Streptomyces sp. JCM17656]|nr:hypothetical protein KJK32_46985 [Streptomyces sp. JCM17656]